MLLTLLKQILIILGGICLVILGIVLFCIQVHYENRRNARFWGNAPLWAQIAYLGLILVIIAAAWFGSNLYRDWYYEEVPPAYPNAEAAVSAGCVAVNSSGELLAGFENWEAFLEQRNTGPAAVQLAVSDGGGIRVVHQLYFDGYLLYFTPGSPYLRQKEDTQVYPFLLCLSWEPSEWEASLYSSRTAWILTDKAELTGEEVAGRLYGMEYDYRMHKLISQTQWLP